MAKNEFYEYIENVNSSIIPLWNEVSDVMPAVSSGNGDAAIGRKLLLLGKICYYSNVEVEQATYYFHGSVLCFKRESGNEQELFEALTWYASAKNQSEKDGVENTLVSKYLTGVFREKMQPHLRGPLLSVLVDMALDYATEQPPIDSGVIEKILALPLSRWSLAKVERFLSEENNERHYSDELKTALGESKARINQEVHMPESERISLEEGVHGLSVKDPYRWLEVSDAKRNEWIEKQNEFAQTILVSTAVPCEWSALSKKVDASEALQSCPKRFGERIFYRSPKKHLFSVKKWGQFPTQVIRSDGEEIHWHANSAGTKLLFTTNEKETELSKFRLRDLNTNQDSSSFEASCAIFTPSDDIIYRRHVAGQLTIHLKKKRSKKDVVVARYVHSGSTSWRIFDTALCLSLGVVTANTNQNTRILYADLRAAELNFVEVRAGDSEDIFVGADSSKLYFVTDRDAPRRKLISLDRDTLKERVELAENEDTLIWAKQHTNGFLAEYYQEARTTLIWTEPALHRELRLPSRFATISDYGTLDERTTTLRIEGIDFPRTIYRFSENSFALKPMIPSAMRDSIFEVMQLPLKSIDGTRISIFVGLLKGLKWDRRRPLLLTGYGGYGVPATPQHDQIADAWMLQGGVFASAVIRGGNEFGTDWHYDACREKMQNSFDDFAACMRHLVDEGFTTPSQLAIYGGSKGGLLVGATITQNPDLCGAACISSPLSDMLRWHLFGLSDYKIAYSSAELGTASTLALTEALLKYSPYHNVRAQNYPPTFIQVGTSDPVTPPAHAYKLAAALQHGQTGDAPIILKAYEADGHDSTYAMREDSLRFLATAVGLV
ncbi:MAG TPA: prolyl oligopeptidase family serine peptidase [Drouetiella sp.]